MDQKINDNTTGYVKNLPKEVQDVIYNSTWEERTLEIAKKYSLDAEQSENLADKVLLVLIGLEGPGGFIESLMGELSISRLLATQIMEDVNTRVFEYALNLIQSKEKKPVQMQQAQPVQATTPPQTSIPEVRPEITPTIARSVPISRPITSAPRYSEEVSAPKPEFVQQPVSVPRFTAVPLDEGKVVTPTQETPRPIEKPVEQVAVTKPSVSAPEPTLSSEQSQPAPAAPQNIMDRKLNGVVKSMKETDPYREPIN